MDVGDERIREMAYYLWEQEGRPENQADRHWVAAVAIVEAQDSAHENSNSGEMTEDSGDGQFSKPTVSALPGRSPAPPPPPPADAGDSRRSAA
jgi:hypothetical protein